MRIGGALCVTMIGVALAVSQWLKPEREYRSIDFDVLREYNQMVAIPVRTVHEIPESIFHKLMEKRVREMERQLTGRTEAANSEGFLGVSGAIIGGAGIGWLVREVRKRMGAVGSRVATAQVH